MPAPREGARPSVWDDTAQIPDRPTLAAAAAGAPVDAEVCVVGAGISGLTTAYELLRAGRRGVVVVDDGPVAGGETGRTTAHVASSFDDYYQEAERMHGRAAAALLGESFRAGVAAVGRIVRDEEIACDYRVVDGYWFPRDAEPSKEDRDTLVEEVEAARRAGFADVALLDAWPLGTLPNMPAGPALRFPGQAQFDIRKYMAGLAAAVERRGGRILSDAHVTAVDEDAGPGGAPGRRRLRVAARGEGGAESSVAADDVVLATNTTILDRFAMHTKQAPYRTYVIGARVRRGAVPRGLYWDTEEPYHYVRLLDADGQGEWDELLVGGEDHKTGQSEDPDESLAFDRLEAWTRARFPVEDVVHRWSGQVMEPVDYVAYIGRDPGHEHVWLVTGDSGNGMTNGTIAGLLLPALIAGGDHPWRDLYDPSRVSLRAAGEWVKENVNVAAQYADFVAPPEADTAADVPAGEGRILRRGAQPLAVYKAEDGAVTVRSAICPHLFCVVDWNNAEKSWDCPCHGSRFAPDGTVINGPSRAPLPEVPGADVA